MEAIQAIQNLDWIILHWIQANMRTPFLDMLMPPLTALGNAGLIWVAAALSCLLFKRYRRLGWIMLLGLALSGVLGNLILKPWIARERPCWLDSSVQLLIAEPRDYSFPSGHSMASAVAAALMLRFERRLGWIAVPLALLIAFSRLYLYVHFPSDVLAGILLGLLLAALSRQGFRLFENLCKRQRT